MENKCPICANSALVVGKVNGYVEGIYYSIFQCNYCELQFAEGDKSKLYLVYDSIYEYSYKIAGYERYVRYSKEISHLTGEKAINYLVKEEDTYKYLYKYLQNIKNFRDLRYLEVGSGLGYLTYALSEVNFDILGVDLSIEAISKATDSFGNLFKKIDINDLNDQFDIILLTEVIEHLENPINFLNDLKRLLTKNGEIILTTPRKYKNQIDSLWNTELPPVHLFWFTTLSLELISESIGMDFFEINTYAEKRLVYQSKNINKATLDSMYIPKAKSRNTKIASLKAIVLSISPIFMKIFYYKVVKKTNILVTNLHPTLFFGYKFKGQ